MERVQINIRFREEDRVLYEWLRTRPGGISAYLRKLIRRDMEWETAKKAFEEGGFDEQD